MADFASVSQCFGKRPQRFQSVHVEGRSALIQQMLAQRRVARFLVAPSGYGKTYLALEYAQTAFGFHGVIWLDANTPEFLRSLDAGRLEEDVLRCEGDIALVVVDDVVRMDVVRADELSRCMNAWLAAGIEVVATLVPSNDAFSRRQIDRLLLNGNDLLLSPRESANGEVQDLADRIACVRWSRHEDLPEFAIRCAGEALPIELACMSFYLMVVGKGSLEMLTYLFPGREASTALLLLARYPHFGIDLATRSFASLRMDPAFLFKAYGPLLDQFAQTTGLQDFDAFVSLMAQECLRGEDRVRACDVVRACGSVRMKRSWALKHGTDLLWALEIVPLLRLLDAAGDSSNEEGLALLVLKSLAHLVIEDNEAASTEASRILAAERLDRTMLLGALLLLSKTGGVVERRVASSKAQDMLDGYLGLDPGQMLLAALACGDSRALDAYAACEHAKADARVLEVACCWLFDLFPSKAYPLLDKYVQRLDAADRLDMGGLLTAKACQRAAGMGLAPIDVLPSNVVIKLFQAEAAVLAIRVDNGRADEGFSLVVREEQGHDHVQSGEDDELTGMALEVNLFGSFRVSVAGRPVDRKALNRTNSRIMLALLALNAGREYSRDRLAQELWPNSDLENARRNCYTAWSAMRRALRLPDGSCPYLFAMSHGYKLDKSVLKLDVDRVRQICGEFRFGTVDNDAWQELLLELEGIISGGLIPGEGSLPVVEEVRRSAAQRVADSLVIGSERLLNAGHAMSALGFIDAIPKEHALREDVCFAKMRAQVACDQRQEALATYFMVKQHLEKKLGIEPSARLTRLYLEIVKDKGQSGGLMDFR